MSKFICPYCRKTIHDEHNCPVAKRLVRMSAPNIIEEEDFVTPIAVACLMSSAVDVITAPICNDYYATADIPTSCDTSTSYDSSSCTDSSYDSSSSCGDF